VSTPSDSPVPSGVRRRAVLAGGALGAGALGTSGALAPARSAAAATAATSGRYFRHGVASGDPRPDRVLLWTRVTPTAAALPGSGRGPRVTVRWEVATDRGFTRVVRRGSVATGPGRDHTVKVDVTGLAAERTYWYRFAHGGETSRVGRTRTAPAERSTPSHLRFGVVSCANWQAGYFSAYRGLADRLDLHAVVHLGDYLYEYGPGQYGMGMDDVDVRRHVPAHEMVSLADYRARHGQYKTDPDLQDAHAAHPWIVTWDDHEVTNDQWRGGAENHQPDEGDYRLRRSRAHQAYDEWMPVRLDDTATVGDGDRIYRRLRFGQLAEFSMLDLRTYRDEQVSTPSGDVSDPDRTIAGTDQLRWLKDSLMRSRVQWKVVGNPVMIAPVTFAQVPRDLIAPVNDVTGLLPEDGVPYNTDQWDGYTADRREVFNFIRNHRVEDVVFITGDIHSGWAADLPYDAGTYPLGGTAGVEFVCTSVTSNNLKDILGAPPHTASRAVETAILGANRHIKHLNFDDHGFSVLDLTPRRAQMDWFTIGARDDRDTPITYETSWATFAGTSTVVQAAGPVR